MEVTINCNDAKLMQDVFIYLHPMKRSTFYARDTYKCVSDKYGNMGEVKLVHQFTTTIGQIKEPLELMADGKTGFVARLKEKSSQIFGMDPVQVCFFRFIHRRDTAFQELIEDVEKKCGIKRVYQKSLL